MVAWAGTIPVMTTSRAGRKQFSSSASVAITTLMAIGLIAPAIAGCSHQPEASNTSGTATSAASTSETATSSPSAAAESTGYVRKNNLPQVSDGGSYERWGIPGATKVASLISAANTPEEAIVAAKAADKDDLKSYVESWVYGQEAEKTNGFIDQLYSQNASALPKSLIEGLNLRGPGKELMQDPEAIVNDMNIRLILASRIAQDETVAKPEREKIIAVLLASMEAPGLTPNPTESIRDYGSNYSYLLRHDYQKILLGFMDRKPGDALQVVPLIVVNTAAQDRIKDPALTASLDILISGKPRILKVDVEVVTVNIYNDTPDKGPVLVVVINTKDDGSSFNLEQITKFIDTKRLQDGNAKGMVANILNEGTKKALFTDVADRLAA
jgi:hypothetical protein